MEIDPATFLAALRQPGTQITDAVVGGLIAGDSSGLTPAQFLLQQIALEHNQEGITEPSKVIVANFALAVVEKGERAKSEDIARLMGRNSLDALKLLALTAIRS